MSKKLVVNPSYFHLDIKIIEKKILEAYQKVNFFNNVQGNNVIFFDIDDTLIYNDTNQVIQPVYNFYNYIKTLGIFPIIITARVKDSLETTKEQLKNLGITGYKYIFFRNNKFDDIESYKRASRKHIHDAGYNILMSIGDMPWDVLEYSGFPILIR